MAEAGRIPPYSKREVACAVRLSALLGWGGVIGIPMLAQLFQLGLTLDWISLVFWYALLGLPISLFFCGLFVRPFLRIMMRRNTSFLRAAYWGAGVGFVLATLSSAVSEYLGWRRSLESNTQSSFGDGTLIHVNGVLIRYEWWILVQNSAKLILMCTLAALVVRLIIGSGNTNTTVEAK